MLATKFGRDKTDVELRLLHFAEYGVATLLHQPFGRRGGSAYTQSGELCNHAVVDFFGAFYEIRIGINRKAGLIQDFAVATLFATYKEDCIMTAGKLQHSRDAVAHLSADGVVCLKGGRQLDALAYQRLNLLEFCQRLCGLRKKAYVAFEIERFHIVGT